jgi:rhamnosyltransferase
MDVTFEKVAGVVILYNPAQNIIENINSYLYQIGHLFIVDNSEEMNPFIKELTKSSPKVDYIFNDDNLGVASALNIGAKKAIQKGFLYLLTMDQDSKAPKNLVVSLLKVAEDNSSIGIVSPIHSNKFGTHIKKNPEVHGTESVMTSGNLLSLSAYKKVGEYCNDFFIDYVDIEYCARLNYNKFSVLEIGNVVLEHNEANISEKRFLFKKYFPTNNTPSRMYYKTRNLLYFRERYKRIYPLTLKNEYNTYFRNIIKIILFEKNKVLKLKMILLGIRDYIKRIKGRKF